jgi:hypothetical protein
MIIPSKLKRIVSIGYWISRDSRKTKVQCVCRGHFIAIFAANFANVNTVWEMEFTKNVHFQIKSFYVRFVKVGVCQINGTASFFAFSLIIESTTEKVMKFIMLLVILQQKLWFH